MHRSSCWCRVAPGRPLVLFMDWVLAALQTFPMSGGKFAWTALIHRLSCAQSTSIATLACARLTKLACVALVTLMRYRGLLKKGARRYAHGQDGYRFGFRPRLHVQRVQELYTGRIVIHRALYPKTVQMCVPAGGFEFWSTGGRSFASSTSSGNMWRRLGS